MLLDVAEGGTIPHNVEADLAACNVKTIYSNRGAFAALCSNSAIIAWGSTSYGGQIPSYIQRELAACNVTNVFSNDRAFAALCSNSAIFKRVDYPDGAMQNLVCKRTLTT